MEPDAITPSTWTAVLATLAGAASLIVAAGLPVVLYWLRNVKAQLDVAHAMLIRQQNDLKANTETTVQIEKQTNGVLAATRDEVTKYKLWAERLDWIMRQVNATEEGRALLDKIMQEHRTVIHDANYDRLISDLLRKDVSP